MTTTIDDGTDHMHDMDCNELVERVTEFLDAAMPAADRRRFEHHIAACPGCDEILEQFRAVVAVTGALRPEDAATLEPARRESLLAAFRSWQAEGP